ncbi:ATP-binding protein [Allorhizobium undicola]|uniref:ATP-binding protein n=1 Tax=Allorhizobium undicola TaxID=78527 RepID=UPI003D34453A
MGKRADKVPGRMKRWGAFGFAVLMVLGLGFWVVGLYARHVALSQLSGQSHADASLKVALLRAVLERPRSLPLLLSEDQQVVDALTGRDAGAVERLNDKLERLVTGTSASVLYVINARGVAIASSNWREPLSFVGADYGFREYFRGAVQFGAAEHFALGNVSKRPGLYISRRVGPAAAPLGVVVVKAEFDQLEADWREATRFAFVTDSAGVVLISSVPAWRFMTLAPLPKADMAAIRDSLQFGDAPLQPLPINHVEALGPDAWLVHSVVPGDRAGEYLHLALDVPSTPWKLSYLVPTEPAISSAAREWRLLAFFIALPVFSIFGVYLWRRQAALARIYRAEADRQELERRVDERTRDLSQAHDRLQDEMAGRRETEARLQVVQQELVQANRLAILGQVAAGVAHEINQPLATIRAYAENALVFLERQQQQPVQDNLGAIARLTARIGTITDELKAFARKGRTAPEPVLLVEAIDGAIVLLRSRFSGHLDALSVDEIPAGLAVQANRIRLEQVLINLFQNALEALEGQGDGYVKVSALPQGNEVAITVRDNGPGIAPEILPNLFHPFNTSKDKGLGLGLVISKDIIADYGGRMDVDSSPAGTCFTIFLQRVPQ